MRTLTRLVDASGSMKPRYFAGTVFCESVAAHPHRPRPSAGGRSPLRTPLAVRPSPVACSSAAFRGFDRRGIRCAQPHRGCGFGEVEDAVCAEQVAAQRKPNDRSGRELWVLRRILLHVDPVAVTGFGIVNNEDDRHIDLELWTWVKSLQKMPAKPNRMSDIVRVSEQFWTWVKSLPDRRETEQREGTVR